MELSITTICDWPPAPGSGITLWSFAAGVDDRSFTLVAALCGLGLAVSLTWGDCGCDKE